MAFCFLTAWKVRREKFGVFFPPSQFTFFKGPARGARSRYPKDCLVCAQSLWQVKAWCSGGLLCLWAGVFVLGPHRSQGMAAAFLWSPPARRMCQALSLASKELGLCASPLGAPWMGSHPSSKFFSSSTSGKLSGSALNGASCLI